MDTMAAAVQEGAHLRQLSPHWNYQLIAASIAVSLLGSFTSTQLMCQARMSLTFSSVLIWTLLSSLTFGFCGIWSLHEVAMLGYELDVKMGISGGLTTLSAILAVVITFLALASDLLWDRYKRMQRRKRRSLKKAKTLSASAKPFSDRAREIEQSSAPLLQSAEARDAEEDERENYLDEPSRHLPGEERLDEVEENAPMSDVRDFQLPQDTSGDHQNGSAQRPIFLNPSWGAKTRQGEDLESPAPPGIGDYAESTTEQSESLHRTSSDVSTSRRSSSLLGSSASSSALGSMMNIAYWKAGAPSQNAFKWVVEALYTGCTKRNILKSFSWSLAITSMHYVGLLGLRVPNGFVTFHPGFVILSAFISWVVCLLGCVLMGSMETRLQQQLLFAVVATAGVAAMHFTGMQAATFYSYEPPSQLWGYPPVLASAVVSIAITTCIAANGLLAHSATVSRNKLAEIVHTRKRLWRTIAQKENAEAAAAARADFISSASHEIRTPLHHLQGYSDLLARTELTEEGRTLLYAIQRATKTLSMITNNVLDWSKLERDAESVCRPVSLDMRTICESIIVLLPNKDDEAEVELLVVVTPDVPHSLFLDETYVHRVLMNLLSNALKFTRSGYILLLVEMEDGKLVATVKDTGCGIPSSFIPQMFEPFKQAQTRGNQRGTGLGLSIIKQLLHKMDGTIDVKSIHTADTGEIGLEKAGSTFTIRIPVQPSLTPPRELTNGGRPLKVGILHSGNSRSLEGLQTAWEKFGYEVVIPRNFSDLLESDCKYIWADVPYLKQNTAHFQQLQKEEHVTVLVPYESQSTLQELPELQSLARVVLLQKPLVWHSFQKRIAALNQPSKVLSTPSRTVRFASKVDLLDGDDKEKPQKGATAKNLVVLLVEDNPINQKLGKKMLTSLGYQVLTAEDGQDAVEQIVKHDATVDAILMDQSMPRKDGITATKEIRDMEASGTLSRSRPIIAVTAVVNSQAQALFKEAGADDFLAKPLSLAKLEQTLAAHVYVK